MLKIPILQQFSLLFVKTITAEFYDSHIILTMICIFLSEFGLKSRNLTLHPTATEKFF